VKTCRQVVTIHDMTFFLLPQCHLFTKRLYFQRLIPECVRRANQVIAVSESTKRDAIRILGTQCEKIKVIYHGKDERFHPDRAAATSCRLRAKHGLSRRVILFVGLIEPRKNLARLIRAYGKLKSLHQDSCLVLVGRLGWGYEAVLRAVSESGARDRIFFPGFIPDQELPSLYNLADVFVYPSLYEGFALPVLEAMACGVPVVTSNVSSMPEIAGDAAFLVDPYDVDGIAQGLERVLVDRALRERLAEEGPKRSQPFTWERTARETLAAYEEAAGK
jgi:glycosyltransferase involved in cell wall biosynthesis